MSASTLNRAKIAFYTILILVSVFVTVSYLYNQRVIDVQIDRYRFQRDSVQIQIDSLRGERVGLFKATDSLKLENAELKEQVGRIANNLNQTIIKYENLRIDLSRLSDDGQLRYFADQVSQ